jgi:hypothetical protein
VAEGVIQKIGWKARSVFERYNIVTQADVQDAVTLSLKIPEIRIL